MKTYRSFALVAVVVGCLNFALASVGHTQNAQDGKSSPPLTIVLPADWMPKALRGCWEQVGPSADSSSKLEVRTNAIVLDGVVANLKVFSGDGQKWFSGKLATDTDVVVATRLELGNGSNGAETSELILSNGSATQRVYSKCAAPALAG